MLSRFPQLVECRSRRIAHLAHSVVRCSVELWYDGRLGPMHSSRSDSQVQGVSVWVRRQFVVFHQVPQLYTRGSHGARSFFFCVHIVRTCAELNPAGRRPYVSALSSLALRCASRLRAFMTTSTCPTPVSGSALVASVSL